MSFDPTAYLAETATLDTPAAPPSAPPPAAFDPSAYLADVGQLNLTDTRAGGPAYQGGPDGSQFSNISSEVADTFANAKQVAPMAIRIGAPMAGVAVGSALTAATGGLALPISMAIAGGSAALAEPFAQMAEKALGQRQDYSVAEGAINTAVAAIPGVPFKNLPLPSITTRAGQILARGAQGAATAAGQDVATRYVRGENDVLATAGNSALIGAGFGALIGTAFDEVARKVNLDKMFTTARNAGFTGETVDDLRRWWQAPDLNQYSLPQAQPTPAPTRPPVLDLEVMPPGGAPMAPGDPILPPGARPLALPPAAVPRDVLRLMPGPAPLALSAPAPEPTAPTPLPVAVDPVQAAPSRPNLPEQAPPAPSAAVQLDIPRVDFTKATAEQIDTWANEVSKFDRNLDVAVLGEETAKRYRTAQRTSNSSTYAASDPRVKAADATIAEIEASLTPQQSAIFFGEDGSLPKEYVRPEEARAFSSSVADIEYAESLPELARATSQLAKKIAGLRFSQYAPDPLSAALIQRLGTRLNSSGISLDEYLHAVLVYRTKFDGNDAAELLGMTQQQAQDLADRVAQIKAAKAGQPPTPLTATMPTTPVSRLAEEGGVPAAESPISGADQPIGRGSQVNVQLSAAPAADTTAARPHAKLTATALKAKIQSLEAGIAKPNQTATRRATLTTDLATYQAEASYRAAAKAAKGKIKGRGFAIPSLPDGSPDLINTLDELGGIRPRPRDYRGGEYDDLDLTKGVLRQLRRQTGRPVDKVLAELNEGYGYRFESPADLQAALDKALLTRARLQQVAGRDQATALFQAAALENKGRGSTASTAKVIAPEQITEGDTFAIKREPVTVAAIDPDTAAITLKDGERFGTQIVPAGVPIYADKGSYQPAPAGEAGLSWGEVVKTNDARIQAEAEAGAQDWEAVVAANHAEAEAAMQDLPPTVVDAVPTFSTVTSMASDTGAAPQSSGSPQSGPENAVSRLSDEQIHLRDLAKLKVASKGYKLDAKTGEIGTFWRNGPPPKDGRSYNFKDRFYEKGVSVYPRAHSTSFAGMTDRAWYRITGKVVGRGSDGEPLVTVIDSKKLTAKQLDSDNRLLKDLFPQSRLYIGDIIEQEMPDGTTREVLIDAIKQGIPEGRAPYQASTASSDVRKEYVFPEDGPVRVIGSVHDIDTSKLGVWKGAADKYLKPIREAYDANANPNPVRTAEGAPRPPAPAQPLVIRPKAQTLDMFDGGLTDMPFTMAGESVQDFTGNMDEVARQAAAKAEADAAQGGLFGAAAGYADWEAVRRIIDPQSVLPQRVRDAVRFGTQAITGHLVRAKDNQADLLRAMNRLRATLPGIGTTVRAYLDGNIPLAALPVSVRVPAQAIRSHIDALSERAVREGVVTGTLARTLLDNQGKYLRRSYRIFDDTPGWIATRDFQVARRNWIAYLLTQPNPAAAGALYTRDAAEILTNQLTDRENATSFMIGGRVAGRDVSSLIRRKDLPPELRALYGEILDPIEAYGQTIPRLARLVENHYAQQWIRLIGLNTGIFSTSATQLNHRPLVSPNNQPHEVWQGLYTQPVIARALEREATTSGRAFSAAESIFKLIRTFTGLSKLTKTVLNPDSYSPNFIGGIITTLANGNFNLLPLGRGFMLASEELGILRAAGILPQNRAQLKDDLEKLAKLGLRMEGLDSADLIRTWETSLLPMLNNRANRIITPVLGAYGQIDNITKYVSWKNEVARLRLWMPPLTPLATLERIAAERVRATTQVYGSIPKIITDLSRLGIAPSFVSFTWELFRNTANTARIAAQDFSEGARTGNRAQQWDGARRLASLLAVVGGGLGILALSRREHDITDQQDDAVRFFGPKYDESSTLHYNSPLKDGRVNVSNASYLLPHMLLTEAVMAGYRGDTGEEQTQRFLNQLTKQFLAADGGVFIGPLAETFVGYNRDTGLPVFNRQSPTPGLDAMGYLGDRTLTPLILRKVENYVKAARGEIGPNGKVFSAADENWRLVGARQQTRDLGILAGYKARDLSRQWVDASRLYTALQGRNVPAADLEAGYQRAATARQAVAAQVKEYFRLGLTPGTGLTQDDLIKNLRSGQGLSAEELLGIIDGKYVDQPRDRSQSAVQVLDRVKRMPEDKRMAAVAAEMIKDPALVKGITREIKTLAKGITQADRLVLSLDIADGSRARYLATQITTQRVSPEAVPAYLAEAKAKGILTDAVYQQLKTGSWRDLDQ